jgi:hypothetical protein
MAGGRRERHGPRAPLSEIVLDWDSHQIISASASDQLIATELIPVWIVRPFVVECGGTLSGDVWILRWGGVRSLGFVNHPDEQVSFSPGPARRSAYPIGGSKGALFAGTCPLNQHNHKSSHRPDTQSLTDTTSNARHLPESFLFAQIGEHVSRRTILCLATDNNIEMHIPLRLRTRAICHVETVPLQSVGNRSRLDV